MFLGHVLLNEGGVLSVNKRVVLVDIKLFGNEDLFRTKLACLTQLGSFFNFCLCCCFISLYPSPFAKGYFPCFLFSYFLPILIYYFQRLSTKALRRLTRNVNYKMIKY